MSLLNFGTFGLWANALIFAMAAACVWWAGTRLTGYLDAIADRTGIGQAFAGMLLLGGITSLPEVAAVSTSSWTGNASLAVNNLLGSVAINVLLIALADAVLGRDAITSAIGKSTTLMQGVLSITALAFAAMAIVSGDVPVSGIGAWSFALFCYCVFAFWLAAAYGRRAPWHTVRDEGTAVDTSQGAPEFRAPLKQVSLTSLIGRTSLAALVILVAGFALAQAGDAISQLTGLGASLVGLVLVGFATSLPEVSSITAAVRMKRYEMALGDVFGTNLLTIGLLLLADVFYAGEPVLNTAGRFEAVAALLGLILTAVFVIGLLERKNKTFLRMGYDALAAILIFVGGIVLLYLLQM
ncbi:sodium:calcium antiporter [Microvirga arabica]|uniref:sodium:calcium antiporter n=1 Tax=Microvirga arabica TaxID=1128671 RepID=UPI001939BB8E|nr:sodium:calcium antiporter [Microvirga arabica]MBM1172814.1 sodium:calcium antiporter [Microvirga arabica]